MSDKKLNVAVIGCGIITWRHLDGMSRIDDCEVYALCETVQDGRAEKLKDKYCTPETKIVTDYKELIGDPNVDAVIITTPDHTHCQITCDFLRDGKPVLLEKPMALKEEECQEMLRCAKETGTMLTVGQVARCVYESLALKYRNALEGLEAMKGQRIDSLNIVGGPINNKFLDQLIADSLDRTVVTGPVEGAAIGNLLTQAMALGHISGLEELRQVVRNSEPVEVWQPNHTPQWEAAYEKMLTFL